MYPDRRTWVVSIMAALMLVGTSAADPLSRYLADDVVAVGYLRLPHLEPATWASAVTELVGLPAEETHGIQATAHQLQELIEPLRRFGADTIYSLWRTSDVLYGGPTWVLVFGEGGKPSEALTLLSGKMAGMSPPLLPSVFKIDGDVMLGARTASQLELARRTENGPRPAAASAFLQQTESSAAGIIITGDQDSRRVIREMLPALPPPFARIDGPFVADNLDWVAVDLRVRPSWQSRLVLRTRDPATAETMSQMVQAGFQQAVAMLRQLPAHSDLHNVFDVDLIQRILSRCPPAVDNSLMSVAVSQESVATDDVRRLLQDCVRGVRAGGHKQQRMNQLKQLLLAMMSYESVHRALPPRASVGSDGQALLSWRVLVLPYLEEQELYDRFHLDEPWDSEHNRQLITQMPAVFLDPDPWVRRAIGEQGRTTFVVPHHPAAVFAGASSRQRKDVTDGASRTIALVEVAPEHAVVWTQPKDWKVDPSEPQRGLERSDRDYVTTGYLDGHVELLEFAIDREAIWHKITRAGQDGSE